MACPSPPAATPAEHPPELAGKGCGDTVTPTRLGRSCGSPWEHHPSITSPLAGWLERPGMSLHPPAGSLLPAG